MAHVEPVVALLLSPVGTARQQAVNILLLDAGPDRRLDGAALPGGGHRSWVSDRGKRMSSVGQTYLDGLAALLERFADRPPARDRDIDWKFLRRTGRGDSRLALGAFFRSVRYFGGEPDRESVCWRNSQEIQTVMPEAVERSLDSYLTVSYEKVGIRFQAYKQWMA